MTTTVLVTTPTISVLRSGIPGAAGAAGAGLELSGTAADEASLPAAADHENQFYGTTDGKIWLSDGSAWFPVDMGSVVVPTELTDLDTTVTGAELDADHAKLGGIEEGATADQTGAEIEAALDVRLGGTSWKEVNTGPAGPTGGTGPAGPAGPSTPSTDAGNLLRSGTDSLLLLTASDLPSGGITAPPSDGNYYAFKDGDWVDITKKIINP
jgi:hypothetical protein